MGRARCRIRYVSRSLNQWVRFRRYRGEQLVGFLPNGKIVFPDPHSEIEPKKPGHYFAESIEERGRVAFVRIIRAHRSSRFLRNEAFGPTRKGKSRLFSYRRRRGRILRFVCDPTKERLELLGFDTLTTLDAEGRWEHYEFRHGRWRLLNYYGPCKMSDVDFRKAQRRVRKFERTKFYGYFPSLGTVWSDAQKAGFVTEEEVNEAYRRSGPAWDYSGD